MKAQIKVIKVDGSTEEYLHTKVLGTICNALANDELSDIAVAEHIAEAVTYFLYHKSAKRAVTSGEIFSIIKGALSATNYHQAAIALSDHHYIRKVNRRRIEIVHAEMQQFADAVIFYSDNLARRTTAWNKSIIVNYLIKSNQLDRQTARTIASMVEEKVLQLNTRQVPRSLIKQLLLNEIASVMEAQRQLQTV